MAGAKETPRQKMIGMMYLVLTAMLALQVSSALIEKFVLLKKSLEGSNATSSSENQRSIQSIREKAAEKPGLYTDVLQSADAVRKLTTETYADLDRIKNQLIQHSGGLDEQGNLKNPKDEESAALLMITQNGGDNLKSRLNKFVGDIQKYANPGTKFEPLALDASENPLTARDPEQRNKNFSQLNFGQTPLPAALAVLSQKQAEVLRYENVVLDQLAAKVGAKELKFDKIFPVVSAKSNTVVAGMKYEAEMYLAATSSAITPRMSFNGGAVPVQNGRGKIEFRTTGGTYGPDGLAKKSWTATISYPDPTLGNRTETVTGEYYVAKPSYSIQSSTLPALYLASANRLQFISPQMGALWNPNFSGSGASFIAGGQGKVTIVPTSRTVAMNVNNQGVTLGTEKFNVKRVPAPKFRVLGNGAQIDVRQGAAASSLRSLSVQAVADEDFASTNPDDARYRVGEAVVSLGRGSRRLGSTGLGNISSLASQAQPGDRYVIEIKSYQRLNFQGNTSSTPSSEIITIPLN